MIVKRKPNPDFNQESILFGSHVLFYSGTRNEMDRISIPSISLNESSDHGWHYLTRLYTGNILNRYECTELPISIDVTEQVNYLSSDEKVPLVKYKHPMFEWATGIPILYET